MKGIETLKEKSSLHPYVSATIPMVEKWLEVQAENGWKLKTVNGWRFTFCKGEKKTRRYFMYSGFDADTGFSSSYYRARENYAFNGSALKRNNTIFEVDMRREDETLQTYFRQRNRYYRRKYGELLVLFAVLAVIACFLTWKWGSPILGFLFLLPVLYCSICCLLLKKR